MIRNVTAIERQDDGRSYLGGMTTSSGIDIGLFPGHNLFPASLLFSKQTSVSGRENHASSTTFPKRQLTVANPHHRPLSRPQDQRNDDGELQDHGIIEPLAATLQALSPAYGMRGSLMVGSQPGVSLPLSRGLPQERCQLITQVTRPSS